MNESFRPTDPLRPATTPTSIPAYPAGTDTTPSSPRPRRTVPIMVAVLAAGVIGGGVGAIGVAAFDDHDPRSAATLTTAPSAGATTASTPGSTTFAAETASKSTADISVTGAQGSAVGSGVILTADGYTLTNNHVVAGAGQGARIRVTTPDGATHDATVTGTAPSYDLAVIKMSGVRTLTPAVLGSSSGLQVGQQVVAVGSPETLSNTVTSGIVSALSRTVTAGDESGGQVAVYNGLQTDTPINPGNSGGPLVNLQGQVIGINSAVDTGQASSGGVQAYGLGFAIPADTAKRVAQQLIDDGSATKPVLGVTGSLATATNSALDSSGPTGATVSDVTAGGAAAQAGIVRGDVITKVDGTSVTSYADLMAQVLRHTPGQRIPVAVTGSDGASKTVSLTLGSARDSAQTTVPASSSRQDSSPFGEADPFGR